MTDESMMPTTSRPPRWERWELLAVAAIMFLGLVLRLHQYELAPATIDNKDELAWSWSGLTLVTRGEPTGWSYIPAYTSPQIYYANNLSYPLVHPWLDEPPLFSWVMGVETWAAGATSIEDVTTGMIRPVPIVLSIVSLFLLYALARRLLPRGPALIGTILLATAPVSVLFDRQVESEALLAPLLLGALILTHRLATDAGGGRTAAILAIVCFAAAFTKVPGLAVGVACGSLLVARGQWRRGIIAAAGTLGGLLAFVAWGAFWNWELFLGVVGGHSAWHGGILGAYQFISEPIGINHDIHDGWWILGWLGLFAIFSWRASVSRFLLWPALIFALTIMILGNDTVIQNYGWYRIPVYPIVYLGAGYLGWLAVRSHGPGALLALLALGGSTAAMVVGADGSRWLPSPLILIAIVSAVVGPSVFALGFPKSVPLRRSAIGAAGLALGLILSLNVVESWNLAQGYLRI